jgi:ferredoxin-thioredoxin reductase catalytic subunit
MAVVFNSDKELVNSILESLQANDGYCPCSIEKSEDTKCRCKEFREQIKDDNFHGTCHCGLFVKE